MTPDTFFEDGAEIQIEARDEHGQPSQVASRNIRVVLDRFLSMAKKTAVVAAVVAVGVLSGTSMAHAEDDPFSLETWSSINQDIESSKVPSLMPYVSQFNVMKTSLIVGDLNFQNDSPLMWANMSESLAICTLSLKGIARVENNIRIQALKSGTPFDPVLMREMLINHEIPHCMVGADIKRAQIEGKPNASSMFFSYFTAMSLKNSTVGKTLQTLTFERQADASALFNKARTALGDAISQAEVEDGLLKFNAGAQIILNMRYEEQRMRVNSHTFNDHDTSPIVDLLIPYINTMARSTETFSKLKHEFQPDNAHRIAMELAIGSVREQVHELHNQIEYINSDTTSPYKKISLSETIKILPNQNDVSEDVVSFVESTRKTYNDYVMTVANSPFSQNGVTTMLPAIATNPILIGSLVGKVITNGWVKTLGLENDTATVLHHEGNVQPTFFTPAVEIVPAKPSSDWFSELRTPNS